MTTLYHASLTPGITRFYGNSHFSHQLDPAIYVAARKYFADQHEVDDVTFHGMTPVLYTLESSVDEANELIPYPDLKLPLLITFWTQWAKIYDHASKEYRDLNRVIRSESKTHEEKVETFLGELKKHGKIGYRYINTIEGGTAISLLDTTSISVTKCETLDKTMLAHRFLKMSMAEAEVYQDKFVLAQNRAKFYI